MGGIVRLLCGVCPVSRILAYVVDGIRSKNNRTRIECVEHVEQMLDRYGVGVGGRTRHAVMPGGGADRGGG